MTYSVLVVDDYEPWRRRVAAELDKSGRWRVVGECVDGADAVREAAALRPDLIILDIGLKTVNGIEAARRIIAGDPAARILFLTGQQSPDVAEAALSIGARGYLFKSEAGPALRRAVEAVVAGARFVSPGLPLLDTTTPSAYGHGHSAVFHSAEAALIDDYARFAETALGRGQPVLVLAPRARLDKIHERLEARGVHINGAIDARRYEACDLDPELTKLMPGGRYDRERLREAAASMLDALARRAGGGPVAACGEIAPRLWKDGRADIALDIEHVWDETARATGADVFCGYCVDAAQLADQAYSVFREICAVHGAVHVR
ncbi:MAG TPA: response regulator [Vicinamibacterales bacterium]|nr:response regulator [Vicinamibacterales bacterium]